MSYQLRMHSEIRDRLTDLRGTEPALARLVGEAVLALLDAGEGLGPPLVVPVESVLRPPDDPRGPRLLLPAPAGAPDHGTPRCRGRGDLAKTGRAAGQPP